jgi:hypothetical protein
MMDPQKKELIDQINEIRVDLSLEPYPYEQLEQFSVQELESFLEKQMALKDTLIEKPKLQTKQKSDGKSFYLNPYYLGVIIFFAASYALIFLFSPFTSPSGNPLIASIFPSLSPSSSTSTTTTTMTTSATTATTLTTNATENSTIGQ